MPTKKELEQRLEEQFLNNESRAQKTRDRHFRELQSLQDTIDKRDKEIQRLHDLLIRGCRPIFLAARTGTATGPIMDTAWCPLCDARHSPATVRYDPDGRPIVVTDKPVRHKEGCYLTGCYLKEEKP